MTTRQASARSGLLLHGEISARLYSPALVDDPERFAALTDRYYRSRSLRGAAAALLGQPVTVRALAIDTKRGLVRSLRIPKKMWDVVSGDLARHGQAGIRLLDELQKMILVAPALRWADAHHNLITTAGRNHIGDTEFTGSSQVGTWYIMLVSATPTIVAGDTMASHGGWTKFTDYDEAAHQAWVETRTANGQWDNSGSVAAFTISTDGSSIGGCALTSQSSKSTDTGTLYSAATFSGGNKAADDGDTLEVTYTQTAADDGV